MAVAIGVLVMTWRRHLDTLGILDASSAGLLAAQAIGRWGNYFNQELFGEPTRLPWGLEIDLAHRPKGFEHELMLSLPHGPGWRAPGPGKTLRLFLFRGSGSDFSEADRALLTLLRPHLHQAYLDAERRRHPVPELTPRQWQLMDLLAAGHTNAQIARRLGVSEGTIRKHLENIYRRLQVSSRPAAITRAFS